MKHFLIGSLTIIMVLGLLLLGIQTYPEKPKKIEVPEMYEETFTDGVELQAVWWGEGLLGYTSEEKYEKAIYYAKSIIVETVYGQMARVPWAKITMTDGSIRMVNLALCEEVILKDKTIKTKD